MFSFLRKQPEDANKRLMKCLRFDRSDLTLNQRGELSASQKGHLHRNFLGYVLASMITLPWLVIFVSSIIWRIPLEERSSHPFIYFIAAVVGISVLVLVYEYVRYRKNLAKGQVVALTGRVKKIPPNRQYLLMLINHRDKTEQLYRVGYWTYHAFLEDETYTIYSPAFDLQTPVAAEHRPSK